MIHPAAGHRVDEKEQHDRCIKGEQVGWKWYREDNVFLNSTSIFGSWVIEKLMMSLKKQNLV